MVNDFLFLYKIGRRNSLKIKGDIPKGYVTKSKQSGTLMQLDTNARSWIYLTAFIALALFRKFYLVVNRAIQFEKQKYDILLIIPMELYFIRGRYN